MGSEDTLSPLGPQDVARNPLGEPITQASSGLPTPLHFARLALNDANVRLKELKEQRDLLYAAGKRALEELIISARPRERAARASRIRVIQEMTVAVLVVEEKV